MTNWGEEVLSGVETTSREVGGQWRAILAIFVFGTIAILGFVPAALGAETRPLVESFGSDGTPSGSFAFPSGLAFDQGNDRLYVLDQEAPGIYGFDASDPSGHAPLGSGFPIAPEGTNPFTFDGLAVDSSSHAIYYISEGTTSLYGFDAAGAPIGGGFPVGGFFDPCGGAVDPSGNVWVGDFGAMAVQGYDSAGSSIGSVDTSARGGPCRLAFDSEANLYVSLYEGGVWRYSAASAYAEATEVDALAGSYPVPTLALAVDRTSDNLYVAHADHVSVYDASGAFLYEFGAPVSGAEFNGIAIDEARDQVFVSDIGNDTVHLFGGVVPLAAAVTTDATAVTTTTSSLHGTVNPNGNQLTDCHFDFVPASQFAVDGYASVTPAQQVPCAPDAAAIPPDSTTHAVSADIAGLDPDTTYHFRLVAATAEGTANGPDRTFTTALGPPIVVTQLALAVGTGEATLGARINPQGASTTYHLEYGTSASYGLSTPESAPIGFPGDDSTHNVSVLISGLSPGTSYHFRFVATNGVGTTAGTDAIFATYASPSPLGACPNDAFRGGYGASLPDCRAYEQASPVDKLGGRITWGPKAVQASAVGDRLSFSDNSNLPTSGGASAAPLFIASRAAGGWSTDGLLPLSEPGFEGSQMGWSEDLASSASVKRSSSSPGIYLRDTATGAQQLAVAGEIDTPTPAGFADDSSHLIFETTSALLTGAIAGKQNLYDLDRSDLTLAGRVPAFPATACDDSAGPACIAPAGGSFAGAYEWQGGLGPDLTRGGASQGLLTENTIAADGSEVFFTEGATGRLYMREDGTATIQISASQAAAPDPNGEKAAAFVAATPDASMAFFLSCEKLTDDSTADSVGGQKTCSDISSQGQDLYAYDTGSGELTDLTVDANAGDEHGAQVVGVLGTSQDGSDVYFVANGVLAGGASAGNCTVALPPTGSCNLYASHAGTVSFIARLASGDGAGDGDSRNWQSAWLPASRPRTSRVAADGTLLFASQRKLTAYDNDGVLQFYRYSPGDPGPACLSCSPTGVAPTGPPSLQPATPTPLEPIQFHSFLTRNISADGNRVFFQTPEKLVGADVNGGGECPVVGIASALVRACQDVYEWEAVGSGSCQRVEANGGCLYLLSTGTSSDPSFFGDASASGDDAFIFTGQALVPQDWDQVSDAYDVRVDGGLASQHPLPVPACSGEGCRGPLSPAPTQPGSGSAAMTGPGNPKHAHKKKKHHKAKHHKKHHKKKSAGKRADRNRGGAK